MTFQVWHAVHPTFRDLTAEEQAAFPTGFTHVADVTPGSGDVGEVFHLTNHITSNWLLNPEVSPKVASARSSSVGDVFVAATDFGARYGVSGIGFITF